jgi:thiamine pyrophosphokinase
MDSIRPDVRGYYESRGVGIIEDGSVDLNDLEKCLWQVKEVQEGGAGMFDAVCIYGGWGGRFDQSMSSLSSLFKVSFVSALPSLTLTLVLLSLCLPEPTRNLFPTPASQFMDIFRHTILVDEETTVTLLKPCEGDSAHVIRPAANVEGKLCGLIPVFGPCSDVTTDGLRWNLKGDELW